MASPLTVEALTPSYVPVGFALREHVFGDGAGGFAQEEDQLGLFFARSNKLADRILPLSIHATAAASFALVGTEDRPGSVVAIGDGRTATYHDGIWSAGPGEEARRVGPMLIHWDRGSVHSLTARSDGLVFAVRGPKALGVTLSELVRVAQSLPIASA